MRQAFDKGFFVGGALASMMTVTKGRCPNGRFPTHPNAAAPLMKTGRASRYPDARRHVRLRQALLGLRLGQPDARRPAEPPQGARRRVRRPVAEAWAVDVPGARVRGRAATSATGW